MARRVKPTGMADASPLFDLAPPMASVHGADGHRARMRDRLLTAGPDALADHEMLEMVLFLALPRRDTKPIARELLTLFGGFGPVIAAPPADLMRVDGLGEAGTAALKLVQAAAIRLLRGEIAERPVMTHWDRLIAYLQGQLRHEKAEQVRVLFLDNRHRLLADVMMGQGTVNHAPVYPREIVRRALELHASAIILVHNHPSGDPTPSREDVAMTKAIRQACEALRITLHDHVVIGGERWISFRSEGLL